MKMKKVKRIITAFMAAALAFGLCQTPVLAAEDFPLSDMEKTIKPADTGLYKYNGWISLAGAPADAKYLQFDYTGDLTTLRIEFQKDCDDDSTMVGPYWFDSGNEGTKFVNANGGDFVLTGGTVSIDLAASGINLADYVDKGGFHLHFGGADESPLPDGTVVIISNAKLTGASSAAAGDQNSGTAGENAKNTQKTDTSKGAAKTGSTAVPTAVAGIVILGAGAVLVYSNKKKAA